MATVLFAQDKFGDQLIQRDGKVIVCQVREILDDEIKYIQQGFRDDVVFGIDKNKVASIVFSDGREMKLSDSMFGKENYTLQRKNALKFNFFSPLVDATAFSYERSLKPGSSMEIGVGIIGLGQNWDQYKDVSGLYFNVGYKFIKDPDFYLRGMRYAHVLKGAYFKPELAISSYSYTFHRSWGSYDPNGTETNATVGAFILNVGKQWVFGNSFLLDWYLGAGYGVSMSGDSGNARNFAFTGATGDSPLVVNAGFRIGFLY
ncbi:MAG TPA: hypothetical protein DCL77_00765 [Prolixibacteraceae bacterium]|nr:hypothetical protein [Prolixibacteraceae bacterium]